MPADPSNPIDGSLRVGQHTQMPSFVDIQSPSSSLLLVISFGIRPIQARRKHPPKYQSDQQRLEKMSIWASPCHGPEHDRKVKIFKWVEKFSNDLLQACDDIKRLKVQISRSARRRVTFKKLKKRFSMALCECIIDMVWMKIARAASSAIFESYLGPSLGPVVASTHRFCEHWAPRGAFFTNLRCGC